MRQWHGCAGTVLTWILALCLIWCAFISGEFTYVLPATTHLAKGLLLTVIENVRKSYATDDGKEKVILHKPLIFLPIGNYGYAYQIRALWWKQRPYGARMFLASDSSRPTFKREWIVGRVEHIKSQREHSFEYHKQLFVSELPILNYYPLPQANFLESDTLFSSFSIAPHNTGLLLNGLDRSAQVQYLKASYQN